MSGLVAVLDGGWAVTVQDRGRVGSRRFGVPQSGALDPLLLAAANALVANPPDAAGLEVPLPGPTLAVIDGPLRLALAGAVAAVITRADGRQASLEPWTTVTLWPGDRIKIGAPRHGPAYVGIAGGFLVPPQLGSRSTYLRAAIGGVEGRAIRAGDRIACGAVAGDARTECRAAAAWTAETGPIRVIPGPQDDHFPPAAWEQFRQAAFTVTRDVDRMGLRLAGPPLTHNDQGAEISSDAVVPGAIQVPADGQPIILLADGQTTGGYAKIATVISADLPRLGHLRPGDRVAFVTVTMVEAVAARRRQAEAFAAWAAGIAPMTAAGTIDPLALYGGNLISGVVTGDDR